ncbi:SDR family NAD(P)-dependent oxidoreductase [Kribbella sp. NPDC055110]
MRDLSCEDSLRGKRRPGDRRDVGYRPRDRAGAAASAELVLHGRDTERGASLVKEIVERRGRARFEAADLADPEEVRPLGAAAGEIDLLVNNAGVYEFASTPDTDVADFDKHFAVNTRAPFLLVGALAPGMARRGHGSIVTISSSAARSTAAIGAACGASKAGVEVLTRYWATEFGGLGCSGQCGLAGPRTERGH